MSNFDQVVPESNFNLNCKNFALTYAQCPTAPAEMLEHLIDVFTATRVLYLQVSQEHHQDGNTHLHALVCLEKPKSVKNARFADLNTSGVTYHPNFKKAWKVDGWKEYISKEGWNTAATGAYEDVCKNGRPPKEKMPSRIVRKIEEGKTVTQLLKKPKRYGNYFINNLAKVKYYELQVRLANANPLQPWKRIRQNLSPSIAAVIRWCGLNLFEDSRPIRTKNLFLTSAPGMGKTTFAMELMVKVTL